MLSTTDRYEITPQGEAYLDKVQRACEERWDRGRVALPYARIRFGILANLKREGPSTLDEVVKWFRQPADESGWARRAEILSSAVEREFEWLHSRDYVRTSQL